VLNGLSAGRFIRHREGGPYTRFYLWLADSSTTVLILYPGGRASVVMSSRMDLEEDILATLAADHIVMSIAMCCATVRPIDRVLDRCRIFNDVIWSWLPAADEGLRGRAGNPLIRDHVPPRVAGKRRWLGCSRGLAHLFTPEAMRGVLASKKTSRRYQGISHRDAIQVRSEGMVLKDVGAGDPGGNECAGPVQSPASANAFW